MDFVTQDGYQYAGLVLAGTFLIPQIRMSVKSKDMNGVSNMTLGMIFFSSMIWGFYMYEEELIYYCVPTLFVGAQSVFLMYYKMSLYVNKYNQHMAKFDAAPPPIVATIEQNASV